MLSDTRRGHRVRLSDAQHRHHLVIPSPCHLVKYPSRRGHEGHQNLALHRRAGVAADAGADGPGGGRAASLRRDYSTGADSSVTPRDSSTM